jgi:hypothetical protein
MHPCNHAATPRVYLVFPQIPAKKKSKPVPKFINLFCKNQFIPIDVFIFLGTGAVLYPTIWE